MAKQKLIKESLFLTSLLALILITFMFVYRWLLQRMKKINQHLDQIVEQRNRELEISNEKLKAFARVASHDLQAPLRSIKGFGQLLKRRYGKTMDDDGKEFLDFITTNSQTMSDLIKEILNTSLLPSENAAEIAPIDLNRIIPSVQLNLKNDIEKYQAEVDYNLSLIHI